MQFKNNLFVAVAFMASCMSVVKAAEGDVLTAVRIVQEMVDQEPFLIDVTSTITWTQGPSITPSATVEPIPDTIETGSVAAQA